MSIRDFTTSVRISQGVVIPEHDPWGFDNPEKEESDEEAGSRPESRTAQLAAMWDGRRKKAHEPVVNDGYLAPICVQCGRRRRSKGPCWNCGEEFQLNEDPELLPDTPAPAHLPRIPVTPTAVKGIYLLPDDMRQ